MEGISTNVLVDSGAALSIIDSTTLDRLHIPLKISTSNETLTDALKGYGTAIVHILGPSQPIAQKFQIIDSWEPVSILLGRDFLQKFGRVTFDFHKNRVQLGRVWIRGAVINKSVFVRVSEPTVIPRRSETWMQVKCNTKAALLEGDFDPLPIAGTTGIYASLTRVIPNSAGIFTISILNVSETDTVSNAHKPVGKLHAPTPAAISSTHPGYQPPFNCGTQLSDQQTSKLISLLNSYQDIFAENPKRPQRNNIIKHKIITENSMPAYQKPRRVPKAWEPEIDSQVNEMLENDIIRPSESPWNSPIILVKKKDNSTRFVCDFRKLNDVTKKDTYPCLTSEMLLTKWPGQSTGPHLMLHQHIGLCLCVKKTRKKLLSLCHMASLNLTSHHMVCATQVHHTND